MRKLSFVLFTVGVLLLLVKLGMWQLSRAEEKSQLLAQLSTRQETTFTSLHQLPPDAAYFRVSITGVLDLNNPILLDNQIHKGRVGYQLHYPFKTEEGLAVLVNMGWLPAPPDRATLPKLPMIAARQTIDGLLSRPSEMLLLADTPMEQSRVQRIDTVAIGERIGEPLAPYVVQLATTHPLALITIWQPSVMGPEKHLGYAVQWFAMALVIGAVAVVGLWRRQWRNH